MNGMRVSRSLRPKELFMEVVFEVDQWSDLSRPTIIFVSIIAILLYIVVPIVLAIFEYRITKKKTKYGIYLLLGVVISAIVLGIYSAIVAILLLICFILACRQRVVDE